MNILITGTSRGIGFSLVTQALAQGHTVIAVARSTSSLQPLAKDYAQKLILLEADVSQASGIQAAKEAAAGLGVLDILINNAGVLKTTTSAEDFTESYQLNTITPFLLTQAVLPLLGKSASPKVIQISTMMASIKDNSSGGHYAYRSSKAALNMINKSLSVDHPKVCFLALHPGWVKTDMGGAGALVEIEDSVKGIWQVIHGLQLKDSGGFKDFRNRELPW